MPWLLMLALMSPPGQRRRSQYVRNESAYPPIAVGEQTSRLVDSVPEPDARVRESSKAMRA